MARGTQRRDVRGRHVPHLVDEQRHAGTHVGGHTGASVNSSTGSISMSPESARPVAAGTSMPGCQRPAASRRTGYAQRERLEHGEELVDPPRARDAGVPARAPPCAARPLPAGVSTGRAGFDLAGTPEPADRLRPQGALSRTVLPTPRRPVSTRLRPAGRGRRAPAPRRRPRARGRARPAPAVAARRRARTGYVPGPR
jgi:hypothetical protein